MQEMYSKCTWNVPIKQTISCQFSPGFLKIPISHFIYNIVSKINITVARTNAEEVLLLTGKIFFIRNISWTIYFVINMNTWFNNKASIYWMYVSVGLYRSKHNLYIICCRNTVSSSYSTIPDKTFGAKWRYLEPNREIQ